MTMIDRILKNTERFRSGYTTKKWEFIYNGGFLAKEGIPYSIFYTKNKEEFYITNRNNTKELMEKSHLTDKSMFKQYKDAKLGIQREIYLKPYQIILTKKLKRQKTISRYFVRYIFDKYDRIFEIKKQDFSRNTNFYDKVSLEWQLQGSKADIILNNNKFLEGAEKILKGIKDFVDPLEFYEEEITPEQIIIEKLERLLHNPHEYNTPEQARSAATALGISGIHRKPDGKWVPGSTQEVYLEAIKKDKITTSAGMEISTRNIVSRY